MAARPIISSPERRLSPPALSSPCSGPREAGGKQYVVIMAGGHHFMQTPISDALVAYALPSG
ncbi:MAG: hypothetical protein WBP94_00435 [Rhodomicrobiaceae bacterium]